MKLALPPLKPRALAVRAIPDAAADLSRALDLPADRRALGIVTATSDDALFTALDQGTKASPAEVVYTKSFYAGAVPRLGAAVGRVHRDLRGARPGRDRRGAGRVPELPGERGLVLRGGAGGRGRARRVLPARGGVRGAASGGAGRRPGRPLAGVPHRAAAGVDRGTGRRVQGGARAGDEVVRPADGDELRRRLPDRRSAGLRGRRPRFRRRDRRRVPVAPARRSARARDAARRHAMSPASARHGQRRQVPRAGDRRAVRGQARSPDAPARRRVPGPEDRPADRRPRQAGLAAVGAAGRAGRGRRGRRPRAGRRAGRDPRAGARAGGRRSDRASRCPRRCCGG